MGDVLSCKRYGPQKMPCTCIPMPPSQLIGYGAIFGRQFFYGQWPEQWTKYNAVALELYPIVVALQVWGMSLSQKKIELHRGCQLVKSCYLQARRERASASVLALTAILHALNRTLYFRARDSNTNFRTNTIVLLPLLRRNTPAPLFAYPTSEPITRAWFNTNCNACLKFLGMDSGKFKGHSFRIGAATEASASGLSDAQIRQLGHWRSDALKAYIRIQ